ncbi:MAG: TetR/AcrR family transcriptional regulator [Spirochaetales bacterium]|nr:TetR/AcrR family transcriptional regulator [Spirochaetales bacterium]
MGQSRTSGIRDLILETAGNIFMKFGFKKTTMEDIANALHRAKSSVYYYFNSKEEIYRDIIKKERIEFNNELNKVLEKENKPENRLKIYLTTRLRLLRKMMNYYSALMDKYLENYPFINEFRKKYFSDEVEGITKILKEGAKLGIYSINNFRQTATQISIALKYLEEKAVIVDKINDIEKDMDGLLNLLLYGIIKRKS